jgi:MinD superfamily P-loop ATPase
MSLQEMVVVSGKGGTGKTSMVGSFAALAKRAVLADCDVDAADLHLLLSPVVRRREEFWSGHAAVIAPERCTACGRCVELCRFGAIHASDVDPSGPAFTVDPAACEGCGVCVDHCAPGAIDFPERLSGEWFVSDTRCGPLVHARLGIAAENSGKLVSTVRQAAREVAQAQGRDLVLVDGPPGIGCPVISTITGASAVLAVTEPTVSGEHDLLRVMELCRHFGIDAAVCVNKWDLNPGASERIEAAARARGGHPVGRIPYDRAVTSAQVRGRAVVEIGGPAAEAIRAVWEEWNSGVG